MTESQYIVAEEKQAHFWVVCWGHWQKVIIHHSWPKHWEFLLSRLDKYLLSTCPVPGMSNVLRVQRGIRGCTVSGGHRQVSRSLWYNVMSATAGVYVSVTCVCVFFEYYRSVEQKGANSSWLEELSKTWICFLKWLLPPLCEFIQSS